MVAYTTQRAVIFPPFALEAFPQRVAVLAVILVAAEVLIVARVTGLSVAK